MKKIKACVFNAYGTLLDNFLPFQEYRDELGENALIIYKLWRSKRLQYSSQLALMNQFTNYSKIQKYALDFACDVYGVSDESLKKKILEAHSKLDCYADVKQPIRALKEKGLTLAILSNGTPQALTAALKHADVDQLFDRIFSTEQVRTYKPAPAVYEYVEEQLAVPRKQI